MGKSIKGSVWERDICKFLTYWVQGKKAPLLFWRQPLSGGMATINELNKNMSGDIRSISDKSKWWPFSVECKNGYPKTSFWQHFKNVKNFNIKDFWIQCLNDSKISNKYPMLIYKKKNRNSIVGINKEVNKFFNKELKDLNSMLISFNDKTEDIIFYDMKVFFNIIKPINIKKLKGKI